MLSKPLFVGEVDFSGWLEAATTGGWLVKRVERVPLTKFPSKDITSDVATAPVLPATSTSATPKAWWTTNGFPSSLPAGEKVVNASDA